MAFMVDLDEVRARLPIVDVVRSVVSLRRAGTLYKGLCPFHNEDTPSFIVTPSRGRFHCFGCGRQGDIFDFIQGTQGTDFEGAVRLLAARAGIPVHEPDAAVEAAHERLYATCAAAALYFQATLISDDGDPAGRYLAQRGIYRQTTERFGLGYAPENGADLLDHLERAGYEVSEMRAAGLVVGTEALRSRFGGRLIFPLRDERGRILGFAGRTLGQARPKYTNSPDGPLYHKSTYVYGLDLARDAIRRAGIAVLVEGYMDVLQAHQAGLCTVVAAGGTAVTAQQALLLRRYAPTLCLALDGDQSGQVAQVRAGLAAQAACMAQGKEVQITVAVLPPQTDPDDLLRRNHEAFAQLVARATPLMDHFLSTVQERLDRTSPRWRQDLLDAVLPHIPTCGPLGVQQHYLLRLEALTHVSVAKLDAALGAPPRTNGARPPQAARARPARAPRPPDWLPPLDVHDPASLEAAERATRLHQITLIERYVLGLLAPHAPLDQPLRDLLATYAAHDAALGPYITALAAGRPLPDEPATAALMADAARFAPVAPEALLDEVHRCLARAAHIAEALGDLA